MSAIYSSCFTEENTLWTSPCPWLGGRKYQLFTKFGWYQSRVLDFTWKHLHILSQVALFLRRRGDPSIYQNLSVIMRPMAGRFLRNGPHDLPFLFRLSSICFCNAGLSRICIISIESVANCWSLSNVAYYTSSSN